MSRSEQPIVPHSPGAKTGHRIDPASGCWVWQGAVTRFGYGIMGVPRERRNTHAHRFYYERVHGAVAADHDLDHLCRNRRCVNPAHLEPVSRFLNTIRGRSAKMTPEKVRQLRRLYESGAGTQTQLGKLFGIDNSIVSDIVNHRSWKDVG